ncbi:MAG: molecular chaperone DnaK [Bdellovibrionales bacterium GWA2_49_15]|nr:MAG: molecular chaperone DnaK [Bdellovibrionales bacterium GWA2_49_15]HAZ12704.1 molecular chaperone DnaK [Bdellovibrionales bacterium]
MAIIGIDLGTSNSAAAVLRGGRPVIIPSAEGISIGGKAFPSYVALTADGQLLVGEPAKRQASANPEGTVSGFKRSMGTRKIFKLRDKEFSPEQLSSFILQKIKRDAEAFLGEKVEKCVITVPAYFDDNQRTATKDAGKIAGLNVERLVNEPTAASLAYGLDRMGEDLKIAVIDLGGGTLDVTIMEFGKGVFEVKTTSGDTQLGGVDMDQKLFEYVTERVQREHEFYIKGDRKAEARVREAVELAKIELTTSTIAHVGLPFLGLLKGAPFHLELDLTRTELERQIQSVVDRCKAPLEQALADSKLTSGQINRIVFVGGPTRMPIVRNFFEDYLKRKAEAGVDPMECVASGAAIQAGVLAGEVGNIVLVDVTPLTLGIETLGGIATPLIPRNTPIPIRKSEVFTTAANMQTSVTVQVFQGERPMVSDNTSLGLFNLDGLPPAPRGVPKIEVTFDIDASGMLNVTAKDLATQKSQTISIRGSTRLDELQKQRMIKDAERYAEEDKKRRTSADKINLADSVCYEAEKTLADFGNTLDQALILKIQEKLKEAKAAVEKRDPVEADKKAEELKLILQEVGKAIYDRNKEKADSGPKDQGRHVVDAEYKETKKEHTA